MWVLKNKPTTQKATKKLAESIANMTPAPNDRPLSPRRMEIYEQLRQRGELRPFVWAIAHCKENQNDYRVNGKHTSTLLVENEIPKDFLVTVEEYVCDTMKDVAQLYATFDSKIPVRTCNDIYVSFAGTLPELAGVSNTTIKLAASGMAYGTWLENTPRILPADRAELLLVHPEFVLWFHELLMPNQENGFGKHIRRQPVIGAMFNTWNKCRKDATEFWSLVRDDSGPSPSSPERRLTRYLLEVGVRSGNGARSRVRTATTREMYSKCVHAWNAWRIDETTNLNYYADKPIPAVR